MPLLLTGSESADVESTRPFARLREGLKYEIKFPAHLSASRHGSTRRWHNIHSVANLW